MIKLFLKSRNENIKEYYINNNNLKIEDGIAHLNLYHRKGFKRKLKLKNKKRPKNVIGYGINGNASGKDGVIQIDTSDFKIQKFLYWK